MKRNRAVITKALVAALLICVVPMMLVAKGQYEEGYDPGMSEEITSPPKYVFTFIGDGVGMPQINAAEAYLAANKGKIGIEKLSFTQFPAAGLTTTYSSNAFITDSAAAATAIACGYKTESGVIAMDPSKTTVYKTIAEMAKEAGMKVGILSSVNLDHATPACYYAHYPTRSDYYNINMQMANSNFDYFAGGMVRIDKTPEGKPSAHDAMDENGWQIASTRSELDTLVPGKQAYAYNHGFASNALKYTIDQESEDITLAEFTEKGIELLDNPNGFFMMIEGGKIDWACHANDAAASIHNTIAFDKAVRVAIDFYEEHPDETLIIVTGDHECGGLTLGFAGTKYDSAFTEIAGQRISHEGFNKYVLEPFKKDNPNGSLTDLMPAIEQYFGLSTFSEHEMNLIEDAFEQTMIGSEERAANDETYLLYGGYEPLTVKLTHIVAQRAGLAWTSYSHTGVPVPTFAIGVGARHFDGYYDNTDIFKKTAQIMSFETAVAVK